MRQIFEAIKEVDEQRVFTDPRCDITESQAEASAKAETERGQEIHDKALKSIFEITGRISQIPVIDGHRYTSGCIDLGRIAEESDLPILIQVNSWTDLDCPKNGLHGINVWCTVGDQCMPEEGDGTILASMTESTISLHDGPNGHHKVNPADSKDMKDVAELLDILKKAEKITTQAEVNKVREAVANIHDIAFQMKQAGLLVDIGDGVWMSMQYNVNDRKHKIQFNVQLAVTFYETGLVKSVTMGEVSERGRFIRPKDKDGLILISNQVFEVKSDGVTQQKGQSNWGSDYVSPNNKYAWRTLELGIDSIRTKTSAKVRKALEATS